MSLKAAERLCTDAGLVSLGADSVMRPGFLCPLGRRVSISCALRSGLFDGLGAARSVVNTSCVMQGRSVQRRSHEHPYSAG